MIQHNSTEYSNNAVDKTITITGLTSENTNTIGILKNDTPDGLSVLDIKNTFNLVDGTTGIKLQMDR